ncbi:MAG: DUF429 domain-containing protein [Gammaproteobacteria bacterium]
MLKNESVKIIGIDLAWQSERNTTAVAIGVLREHRLVIEELHEALEGFDAILAVIANHSDASGISIDAPLVIPNKRGQRACERALGSVYGRMKASCHASNLSLYPDAASTRLAATLSAAGFLHLGSPSQVKWQIECYPHPAMIEIFRLPERLRYKKGGVGERRAGQVQLARYLRALESSQVIALRLASPLASVVEEAAIRGKRGKCLKRNEDALDAIICTYIGALYARGAPAHCFGTAADGYIYVPALPCL